MDVRGVGAALTGPVIAKPQKTYSARPQRRNLQCARVPGKVDWQSYKKLMITVSMRTMRAMILQNY